MNQRLRMLINNHWDDATLSLATGTIVPSLPLSYSQVYGQSKTTAITPNAGQSVLKFDLANLNLVSGFVMYRHWHSVGAKWKLELFDGIGQQGNKVYDSQLVEMTPTKTLGELDWLTDNLVSSTLDNWPYKFSQLWFDGVFAFSGRLTLVDENAREGLHEFDRVYLGNVIQPSVNFNYNHQHSWATRTTQKDTAGGSVYGVEKTSTRQLSFTLGHITEQERPHFSEAIRNAGLSKDWFISMFPEQGGIKELEYAMACKFVALPAMPNTYHHNYTITINVKEA